MNIKGITPSFKANYYKYTKNGNNIKLNQIKTDNAEKLGSNPILLYSRGQIPMTYDGRYYTANLEENIVDYSIYYQDTGKFENGEELVHIDFPRLEHMGFIAEKTHNNSPLAQTIVNGEVSGKLVKVKKLSDIEQKLEENPDLKNESLILLVDDERKFTHFHPENVQGIIFKNGNLGQLSHEANIYRMYTGMVSSVFDEKVIEELNNRVGEYVTISNQNEQLDITPISKFELNVVENRKIDVPQMDSSDKILKFNECTKNNCGNKAYRLSLLHKLAKIGFLTDVTIPKGFVLPYGYLDNLQNYFLGNQKQNFAEIYHDNKYKDELLSMLDEHNIDSDFIIVRSAFNGEDLPGFSAAGLYDSCVTYKDDIVPTINHVIDSKDSKRAQIVRAKHQIPDNAILPSIIVEEYIPADYAFTMYTNTGDNKMLIEVRENHDFQESEPAFITYDRNNNTFEYSGKICSSSDYLVDDNYKILKQNFHESSLTKNFDKLRHIFRNLVNNAEKIEKIFANPQDIEGGIKDGKLFLWQARDIVKRV